MHYLCASMFIFKDKVIAITGASSGIGHALALQAVAQGAKVAVCGRSLEKLRNSLPAGVLCIKADVAQEQDCKQFIEQIVKTYGRLDVLINNAGISMRALFDELDLKVMQQVMDINFWGAVYCTRHALPYIMQSEGVIVGLSSIAGYRGLPCRSGYSASKFALQGFLESLRTELLLTGVHVMWVCPGFTASNIRQVALNASGKAQGETPMEESKLMSAETCARIIFKGIAQRKRTIVMTGQGKLTVWLNKLLPALADILTYNHFLKEPNSPLKKYEV